MQIVENPAINSSLPSPATHANKFNRISTFDKALRNTEYHTLRKSVKLP